MSSPTTTTSLPKGNGRRWGWWGRTDKGREYGERGAGMTRMTWTSLFPAFSVNTRGDGGQGATTGYIVVPQSWRRSRMAHMCLLLPTPPVPAASSTGAGVNPTRCPHLTSFTPPHWGVSSPASFMMTGAACALYAAPFLFFNPNVQFPPFWGILFFFHSYIINGGSIWPAHPSPFISPNLLGVFSSAATLSMRGQHTTHLLFPPLSFTPHKSGEIVFLPLFIRKTHFDPD